MYDMSEVIVMNGWVYCQLLGCLSIRGYLLCCNSGLECEVGGHNLGLQIQEPYNLP